MKLNYIILFSLFFIVSLAAGCTSSVKEEMNPIIVSQLNLTDSKKQSLTGSLQGIHQTETGENISLSVHQTLGNERELFTLSPACACSGWIAPICGFSAKKRPFPFCLSPLCLPVCTAPCPIGSASSTPFVPLCWQPPYWPFSAASGCGSGSGHAREQDGSSRSFPGTPWGSTITMCW